MRRSTSPSKNKAVVTIAVALFWLGVWQTASVLIGEELFFSSPVAVFKALRVILRQPSFYKALWGSFSRISTGFVSAVAVGVIFAVLCSKFKLLRTLMSPLFTVIRSTPVASFVILVIIMLGSERLAAVISFLMVLPVIYSNTLAGIDNTDKALLEMAKVFGIGAFKTFRYIRLPAIMPFFLSACSVSLGLCWKSGVAAEVIGITGNSLGKLLYESKIYYSTAELFAYTFVIVSVSFVFEKAVIRAIKSLSAKAVEGSVK